MTIIVFLLDTSASMNQRVFLGGRPTLLDVAKSAVETFVKVRQRSIDSRQDRYMLLTFEDPPGNIKAGWKENLGTFMSELKNLQANGLTTLGHALRHTFDVLNVNRMQHGIDTYGQGRCPFYLEPSIIVAITDGGRLSSNSGVQEELKMHGSSPGFELTREPFRWDQRLFSLVLRMSGQPASDANRDTGLGLVPSDASPIDAMCEVTGGRSYCITTHRMLHQCIDSLVQKVQAGVVIHFEKVGSDPPPLINSAEGKDDTDMDIVEEKNDSKQSWHNSRKMIYVPRTNQKGFVGGFWPIPESFWPDITVVSLPPRSAHPHVKFTCIAQEPLVIENFPFDKYELEPSPLTQYILARKQPSVCWQTYIGNGSKNGQLSQPFGYLKASTNLTCVNLFVMPHNYPVLLPLLDDLFRLYRLKPSNEWKAQFGMYVSSMPAYYAGPLKRALIRMGAGVIAQSINEETFLSYSVLNYLKKLKAQAKVEFERTCSEVGARVKLSESKQRTLTSYKNPFDVPRHLLLDHIAKLRTSILKPRPTSDLQQELLHSMPVGQMGNYQEYLKRMPTPLREIESTPVRQHMFGNPFKIDKRMIIDEADMPVDILGQQAAKSAKKEQATLAAAQLLQNQNPSLNNNNNNNISRAVSKRKPGPLPRDYSFTPKLRRRDSTSSLDSNSSSNLDTPPSSPFSSTVFSKDILVREDVSISDSYSQATPVMSNFSSFYNNNKEKERANEKDPYEFNEATSTTKITSASSKKGKACVPENETPMEIDDNSITCSSSSSSSITNVPSVASSSNNNSDSTASIKSNVTVKEKNNDILNNIIPSPSTSVEELSDSRPNNSYLGTLPLPYEDFLDLEDDEDDEDMVTQEQALIKSSNSSKPSLQGGEEEKQSSLGVEKDNSNKKIQPQSERNLIGALDSSKHHTENTRENNNRTGVPSHLIGIKPPIRTNTVVPVNGDIHSISQQQQQQQYSSTEQNTITSPFSVESSPVNNPVLSLSGSVHSTVPISRTNGLPHTDVINNHVSPSSSNPLSSVPVPEGKVKRLSKTVQSHKKVPPASKLGDDSDSKLSSATTTASPMKDVPLSSLPVPETKVKRLNKTNQAHKKEPSNLILGNKDDLKLSTTTTAPSIKDVPKLDDEAIRQRNFKLRTQLYSEIRRPVFRSDVFLSKLKEVVGSPEVQREFVRELRLEALRFKRKRVAELLARNLSDISTIKH